MLMNMTDNPPARTSDGALVELVHWGDEAALSGDASMTPVTAIPASLSVLTIRFGTLFSRLRPILEKYAPRNANAVCMGSAYLINSESPEPATVDQLVRASLDARAMTEDKLGVLSPHPHYSQVAVYLNIPSADYRRGVLLKPQDWFVPAFRKGQYWSDDRACSLL